MHAKREFMWFVASQHHLLEIELINGREYSWMLDQVQNEFQSFMEKPPHSAVKDLIAVVGTFSFTAEYIIQTWLQVVKLKGMRTLQNSITVSVTSPVS